MNGFLFCLSVFSPAAGGKEQEKWENFKSARKHIKRENKLGENAEISKIHHRSYCLKAGPMLLKHAKMAEKLVPMEKPSKQMTTKLKNRMSTYAER